MTFLDKIKKTVKERLDTASYIREKHKQAEAEAQEIKLEEMAKAKKRLAIEEVKQMEAKKKKEIKEKYNPKKQKKVTTNKDSFLSGGLD